MRSIASPPVRKNRVIRAAAMTRKAKMKATVLEQEAGAKVTGVARGGF